MLRPWSIGSPPARERCAIDAWLGEGWTLLERHARAVRAAPESAVEALRGLRLRDLPVVRALFALRGLRHGADETLDAFFSTAPFLRLEEIEGREIVSGVLVPRRAPDGRRRPPAGRDEFRHALESAPFAALATFRADPLGRGALLWTETWVRTRGAAARAGFGAYWLAIGPWSAWIRRIVLRRAGEAAEARPAVRGRDRA